MSKSIEINDYKESADFDLPEIPSGADLWWARVGRFVKRMKCRTTRYMHLAERVDQLATSIEELSDSALNIKLSDNRDLFKRSRETEEQIIYALALVREVARRERNEKPYLVQLAGAYAMLEGCVAEMATGEGKTLTASLAATLIAWRGKGCHVLTVNEYLAARDAELMSKVYKRCGLVVAALSSDMQPNQRKSCYLADITYATNNDVTADFLRDRLARGTEESSAHQLLNQVYSASDSKSNGVVQRPLYAAIVDEADSVLIDEAVTPLLISGKIGGVEDVDYFNQAISYADNLVENVDYKINDKYREIVISKGGREKLLDLCSGLGGVWESPRRCEELIRQAITSKQYYRQGKQYVVNDGKVVIVDESTGRLMPDREWRDGMHQMVSAKEGLDIPEAKETQARLSFQRYFRMYPRLAGMTGTAWEATTELWDIYKLSVVKIPTNRPCIRKQHKTKLYKTKSEKNQAILEALKVCRKRQQPCLIGTRQVKASEKLFHLATKELGEGSVGINVLNAVNHELEAEIVAGAGKEGAITIATNMAGRGTDIKLKRKVKELGGLEVILSEPQSSGRVDRQFYGRSGRQGDPGSAILFASLEDELLRSNLPKLQYILKMLIPKGGVKNDSLEGNHIGSEIKGFRRMIVLCALDVSRRIARHREYRQRCGVLVNDTWLDQMLGFTGNSIK